VTLPDHQTTATCEKFREPYILVPVAEIYRRITALQSSLIEHGLSGCLDAPTNGIGLARGSKQILEPGMVFAFEPKFIFPGRGVATIENTYLLTNHGCRRLTTDDENIFVH